MKKQLAIISLILALTAGEALAQRVHVHGYVRRSNGTYVIPDVINPQDALGVACDILKKR